MSQRADNPFPGVNPYIEWEGYWRDFHSRFINYVAEGVLAGLPAGYDARIEEDALLIDPDSGQWHRFPDVAVIDRDRASRRDPKSRSATVGLLEPTASVEPEPIRADEERRVWIEVRDQSDDSLVTSIEILSPTNKVGTGRGEFRFKRKELFDAGVNLVDIDLLLGGVRLPFKKPLPPAEFYAFVSRPSEEATEALLPTMVEVYAMKLTEPLGRVPIPLRAPDPDLILSLQPAYDQAFSRGGYPRRLRYPPPPESVDEGVKSWAASLLTARRA